MRLNNKIRGQEINTILLELFPEPRAELDYTYDYELLFAVIMSAQTTDKQVNKLTSTLYKKYDTLFKFAKANIEELTQDMNTIGLYKNKAKFLIKTANKLIDYHDSKVPANFEIIQSFDGAAIKTANVVMSELFNINSGIAVDTHVKRLAFNFGLTKHTDPIKIENDLKKIFPLNQWGMTSLRLILYGRRYYKARTIDHDGPLREYVVNENNVIKKNKKTSIKPHPKSSKGNKAKK